MVAKGARRAVRQPATRAFDCAAEFGPFCERIGLALEPLAPHRERGARPEREFVVIVPRGGGKTTLRLTLRLCRRHTSSAFP
jgi:hypothetical protein